MTKSDFAKEWIRQNILKKTRFPKPNMYQTNWSVSNVLTRPTRHIYVVSFKVPMEVVDKW